MKKFQQNYTLSNFVDLTWEQKLGLGLNNF